MGTEPSGSEGTEPGGIKTSRDKSPLRTGSRSGPSLCRGVVCTAHGAVRRGITQDSDTRVVVPAQPPTQGGLAKELLKSQFPHLLNGVICFAHKVFYIY